MPIVNFVNEKKQVQVPDGANLRQEALKAGINPHPHIHQYFPFNCHGLSLCGSCRVLLTKGAENASSMGVFEKLRLKFSFVFIGNEDKMRLACQTKVHGDMDVVTKPPMNLYGENFFS
jgi:2Fe-2S ferredoxin